MIRGKKIVGGGEVRPWVDMGRGGGDKEKETTLLTNRYQRTGRKR